MIYATVRADLCDLLQRDRFVLAFLSAQEGCKLPVSLLELERILVLDCHADSFLEVLLGLQRVIVGLALRGQLQKLLEAQGYHWRCGLPLVVGGIAVAGSLLSRFGYDRFQMLVDCFCGVLCVTAYSFNDRGLQEQHQAVTDNHFYQTGALLDA